MGIDDDDDDVGEVGRVGSLIGWLVLDSMNAGRLHNTAKQELDRGLH